MKQYQKVHPNTAAEIKVLFQVHRIRGKKLLEKFPHLSRATIYKHAQKPLGSNFEDRRKRNRGRPAKITPLLTRRIKREVEMLTDAGNGFTSKDIQHNLGLQTSMCNRTVRRELNKMGIKYLHLRKKGVLLRSDLKKRLKFARKCKRILQPSFYRRGISMYLDGVGFEWKSNPCKSTPGTRTMGWRRRSEGLDLNQTSKGKKEGKTNAHFYVGIGYGRGVVCCKAYTGRMNAEKYNEHILPSIVKGIGEFNPMGRRILQDNCSIMNSTLVRESLFDENIKLFKIPARSPDINCIENVFHKMRKAIQRDAINRNIQKESFRQFQARCARIIRNFSSSYIDKVIESMPKRIDLVIKRKGQRIRY